MSRAAERTCQTTGRRRPEKERPAVWSAYGKLLRLFRERAGLTQQGLADAIGYSVEQVASVEQGRRPAKVSFTEASERVLGTGGALRVLQEDVDLAKLPAFFHDFALLEAEAVSRFSYDPMLVPGLLQTESYARALLEAHFPPLDEEAIEQHLTARLARQSLLTRKNPCVVFSFIIEEAALHRMVGGTTVVKEQLERLRDSIRLRNVEVQVMPTQLAAHSGVNGQMVLLETLERRQFVCIEAQGIMSIRSVQDEVSEFWLRYGMLRSQALHTEESARLIEHMAGEL
jgi:transcriptional regulator with XRE-family HTH domain